MVRFVKDLLHGEPVMFVSIISAGLSAWQATLIAMNEAVPLVLAIATPVWIAAGAAYARGRVTPTL